MKKSSSSVSSISPTLSNSFLCPFSRTLLKIPVIQGISYNAWPNTENKVSIKLRLIPDQAPIRVMSMIDPVSVATIFTAFIPTASYAIKRIVDYKTGGAIPTNSTEEVELRKTDVEMAKVINAVPSNISRWVANIIALQRPVVIAVILFNWSVITICGLLGANVDLQIYIIVANLASSAIFYLFGDRSLMYSLHKLNKLLK